MLPTVAIDSACPRTVAASNTGTVELSVWVKIFGLHVPEDNDASLLSNHISRDLPNEYGREILSIVNRISERACEWESRMKIIRRVL